MIEDGRAAEVYLERPERRSIAGNIYKGTVDNVLPGMEAAFIEIGLEKNGFLYVDEIVGPELEGRRHGRKIQDLIKRGQEILVQSVKDPMKSKGARLTTEISLPGRFVVYVPHGEGLGVSRRLEDAERDRLRDIVKAIAPKKGGVIVRTAAEGASAEDVERDLAFLMKLWKSIEANAEKAKAPALVYQEAELPLRVTRDLFTHDFEKAVIDDEKTFKRIVGYLKKTSPHMVDRVIRYREKTPLFEKTGVEDAIQSTISRRVDLPSGGYLVFDYAEAFTVIDVNTGRFVGSRSKSSAGRLEDTITANNLEAVKEVVHQLRLRDIGGIIVIDFIDMGSPKNRATVEEALKTELERDRTKTYVVEISPLGLVEMTRQNVTEGPREILTQKCPTCAGDGIVLSTHSAAIDAERRLRALAVGSKRGVEAIRVELEEDVARHVIGSGGIAPRRDRAPVQAQVLHRGEGRRAARPLQGRRRGQARGHRAEGSRRGGRGDPDRARRGRQARRHAQAWASSTAWKSASPTRRSSSARRSRPGSSACSTGWPTRRSSTPATAKVDAPITAEAEAEKPTRAPRKKVEAESRGSGSREGSGARGRGSRRAGRRRRRGRGASDGGAAGRRARCRGKARWRGTAEEADEARIARRPQPAQEAGGSASRPRTASRPPSRCRSQSRSSRPEPEAKPDSASGRHDPRPVCRSRHRGDNGACRRRRRPAEEEANAPRQPRRPKPPQEAGRRGGRSEARALQQLS